MKSLALGIRRQGSISMMERIQLTVVVPCLNEASCLEGLVARISTVIAQMSPSLDDQWQLLLVDDGSTDRTWQTIEVLCSQHRFLSGVRIGENVGQQAALLCGYHYAVGEWVLTLDADLQDPPETLLEMWAKRSGESQVMVGRRMDRSVDGPLKRITATGFYCVMQILGMPRGAMHAGEFRLISRQATDALIAAARPPLFHRLTILELGFPVVFVEYTRASRISGVTKFTFRRMLGLAWCAMWSSPRTRRRMTAAVLWFVCLLGGLAAINQTTFSGNSTMATFAIFVLMIFALAAYGLTSLVWLMERQEARAPFRVIARCGNQPLNTATNH
jgi:dolichol-phosphate mannosyltransferase